MALLWSVVSVGFSLLLTPFLMFLLAVLFLASIGKSLGVRRLYVKLLLAIFEFGRQNIEKVRKNNRNWEPDESEDESGASEDTGNDTSANFPRNYKKYNATEKKQNGVLGNSVIARSKDLIMVPEPEMNNKNHINHDNHSHSYGNTLEVNGNKESSLPREDSFEMLKREFDTSTCLDYIRAGVEAIIEDEVTSRFEAEELKNWNLLTRTNRHYEFISWKLTVIWMFGFLMRYCFLLPLRILICFIGVMWLTACTAVVGYVPEGRFKRWLNHRVSIMCFSVLSSALSSVIHYHNTENRPLRGICVANHTSPIDVLVLMRDNSYSLIGQRHGGFLGILQRALARASPHIWFERSEVKDREAVTKRLKKHVSDPSNPPILIFPEGTCINNTSVMQFKKGSFEVGGVIYPVAIKYDPKFGDAFWNSSKYSMIQYLYMMMSSWAIVCDVWYLPPMYRQDGESAIDFANRVKAVIARQGGLVDLQWDGQLKRIKPKKAWREKQQEEFSKRIKFD
ncbi:glycerol-3-phosphate acyltransferase 3 isoform X6 [Diprion similis]|uniref:glycerol-3-phosphate acyltransferase 3 isoform X6 n=1 Tax=Diprion similis TaxID=362088 RepID=UPI001EF871E1|nr:glycerol-3-phosphate acyltransferase 3 isoform X6 [Diprion similis]